MTAQKRRFEQVQDGHCYNTVEAATLARRIVEGAEVRLAEDSWLQETLASDMFGKYVEPEDDTAVAWCLTGALERSAHDHGLTVSENLEETPAGKLAVEAVREAVGIDAVDGLDRWNDARGRTEAEVQDALRRAAQTLQQEYALRNAADGADGTDV